MQVIHELKDAANEVLIGQAGEPAQVNDPGDYV